MKTLVAAFQFWLIYVVKFNNLRNVCHILGKTVHICYRLSRKQTANIACKSSTTESAHKKTGLLNNSSNAKLLIRASDKNFIIKRNRSMFPARLLRGTYSLTG